MAMAAKFHEDKSSKKPCAFVISARVRIVSKSIPNERARPISVSYDLLAAKICLGDSDSHESPCRFPLDSCASMNTGNILVNKWFVTKYPDTVDSC